MGRGSGEPCFSAWGHPARSPPAIWGIFVDPTGTAGSASHPPTRCPRRTMSSIPRACTWARYGGPGTGSLSVCMDRGRNRGGRRERGRPARSHPVPDRPDDAPLTGDQPSRRSACLTWTPSWSPDAASTPPHRRPARRCGSAEHSNLATARVDTLPGRIISVTSPAPTAWADTASGWQLVPAGVIGGETGTPGELIDPGSIAVDAAGRIYVADSKPEVIKVFGPDGKFLHTSAGKAKGRASSRPRSSASAGRSWWCTIPVSRARRCSIPRARSSRAGRRSCCYYGSIGVDTAGRISILTMTTPEQKRSVNYTRYTLDGTFVDTIFVPQAGAPKYWTVKQGKNSMMSTGIPAEPRMVSAPIRSAACSSATRPTTGSCRVPTAVTPRPSLGAPGRPNR